MYLTEKIAREIINLNPFPEKDIIDPIIAERQFQVILKGANYLLKEENDFLYIGDEVGLGKTYIALGIASILQVFSNNTNNYINTILVPKENLQYKWHKEIKNFISNNYKRRDNRVKSVLGRCVSELGANSIKKSMEVFEASHPQYIIYRNSSFSIASENTETDTGQWIERLEYKLPLEKRDIFNKISKRFIKAPNLIKRAYAYLLNQSMPNIDMLIVDEAHNFKHGTTGNHISIRNQIVSRLFGADSEDNELFEEFPELKELYKPKINKLLLLSATPINKSLIEIKNQLDCFLNKHLFTGLEYSSESEQTINKALNKFMIRGIMTTVIEEKEYSRNGYRHEHRKGNVLMEEKADHQHLKDNATSLVLSLMQYKTIKELKQKSNNQFEMGMLAGFESFSKTTSAYEDDTIENRNSREAKDENVIKDLIESYYSKFNNYPLHPKQESLVDEIFKLIVNREKSLVFVRRITSVREIERKLLKKYSDYLISKIETVTQNTKIRSIEILLQNYREENLLKKAEGIIDILSDRISAELKPIFNNYFSGNVSIENEIAKSLKEIYYSLVENEEIEVFKIEVKNHIDLTRIKHELKDVAVSLVTKKWQNILSLSDEESGDEDDENTFMEQSSGEENSPYFFQRFFNNEGKKFKIRSYKKNWYELNLLLINDMYNLFSINHSLLSKEYDFFEEVVEIKKQNKITEVIIQAINSEKTSIVAIKDEFRQNTFLTELLLNLCSAEFSDWIDKHKSLIKDKYYTSFLDELNILTEILKSIFRQGSGLLPVFIAEAKSAKSSNKHDSFISEMNDLLKGEFDFVLHEIKQIIVDYSKLVERNFDDVNKIRYSLIQQLPITGVSGQHKKDVRKTAIQFRMPGYPYVLITTDILKEGEDLHTYCKNIYHYGIAWNPSDMEQRTGRIDRIDSLAYRSLKKIEGQKLGHIPFNNKLQVFYPYLADTLEVNQMIKLFNGMDKFIEIFYNDLSAKIDRSSSADVDEVIIDIPKQREGLLSSKYDYDSFIYTPKGEKLQLKEISGSSFEELNSVFINFIEGLRKLDHISSPSFDKDNLVVSGVLRVNNRYGPYKAFFKQSKKPGTFFLFIESFLGRAQIIGKSDNKERVKQLLIEKIETEDILLEIVELNSDIFISTEKSITNSESLVDSLYKLVKITDDIENEIIGTDEVIDN